MEHFVSQNVALFYFNLIVVIINNLLLCDLVFHLRITMSLEQQQVPSSHCTAWKTRFLSHITCA